MTQLDLSPFMFNYMELYGNTLRGKVGGCWEDGHMEYKHSSSYGEGLSSVKWSRMLPKTLLVHKALLNPCQASRKWKLFGLDLAGQTFWVHKSKHAFSVPPD
jgi:hypothetical protein